MKLLCYGTVAGGFLSRALARRAGAAGALREPLAHQVQADHRRFRRLGPVPGAARTSCRRSAQRHGVDIATVATRWVLDRPAGGRRHRRRALRRAPPRHPRRLPAQARRPRPGRDRRRSSPAAPGPQGDTYRARARPRGPARPHHEVQSQRRLTPVASDPSPERALDHPLARAALAEVIGLHVFFEAWLGGALANTPAAFSAAGARPRRSLHAW